MQNSNFFNNVELQEVDDYQYGSVADVYNAAEPAAPMTKEKLIETGKDVADFATDFIPGVSEAKDVYSLSENVSKGDYIGAGIDATSLALGIVPGVGDLARKGFRSSVAPALREFATPLKTVKKKDSATGEFIEKLTVPIKPKSEAVIRADEELTNALSSRMKRATDSEKFPEAASILPAPGRFFDPARRDYKEGMAKGLAKAGIKLDLDFGNYIMMGKGKPVDVSNETFENLFISPRTSFKRSKGTNTSTARANQFAENLSIEDMKKNYKQNTGKDGKEINTNLLQPERFKVIFNKEERILDHPIVAVQPKSGKHYYTLDTQFVGPVNMKRMTDKVQRKLKSGKIKEEVPQPNLRPATVGDVRLGNVVSEIKVGNNTHPLYDYIEVDAVPSFSKGVEKIEKFKQGGLMARR